MRLTSVDLPEPLRPTTPTISPGAIVKLTCLSTGRPCRSRTTRLGTRLARGRSVRAASACAAGRAIASSLGASSRSPIRRLVPKKLANQAVDSAIVVSGV